MKQSDLKEIAKILRSIAKDLEDCGTDEWDSLGDCIEAIRNNVSSDLFDRFGTSRVSD